jgi:hypothetical protein
VDDSGDGCSCPIHAGRDREPFTAPLGLPFAGDVRVRPVDRATAGRLYESHHSYMSDVPEVNLTHHGLTYQRELLGAITYRYPLISRKKVRFDKDGNFLPEPLTERDFERLPDTITPTAKRIVPRIDPSEVAETRVVDGDRVVEAARICLGARMPNFASAALARSQEAFIRGKAAQLSTEPEFLLTFVRADYDGAMIRALRDKGWTCTGWTEPSQPNNRESKPIRERYKWRFLCPVETAVEQAALGRWS